MTQAEASMAQPVSNPPDKPSTAEQIRRLAQQNGMQQTAAPANARAGMNAQQAMAYVQSLAAAPGQPTTHEADLQRIAPLMGLFATQLGLPAATAAHQPNAVQHGFRQLDVAQQGTSMSSGHSTGHGTGAQGTAATQVSVMPMRVQSTAASASHDHSNTYKGHQAEQSTQHSAQDAAESLSADEAVLDVLTATMDAWEEALTKRLTATITSAVKSARQDVLEV